MSVEDHVVSFSLQVNVEDSLRELRRLQTVLYRTLHLYDQLGIHPELSEQIRDIQLAISWLNQLRLAWIATQTAMGPVGWALAGISIGTAFITGGGLDIPRKLARKSQEH